MKEREIQFNTIMKFSKMRRNSVFIRNYCAILQTVSLTPSTKSYNYSYIVKSNEILQFVNGKGTQVTFVQLFQNTKFMCNSYARYNATN